MTALLNEGLLTEMETNRSVCSLVTEEDRFNPPSTHPSHITNPVILKVVSISQPAVNLGRCCHDYPCTIIISLNESIRYNGGIYDLCCMSVTQAMHMNTSV